MHFEDSGNPNNPLGKDDSNTTLDVQEHEIGGLGVFMAKSMMDAAEYRNERNKNILTIKKAVI